MAESRTGSRDFSLDWKPGRPTQIKLRRSLEPRDERLLIAKCPEHGRSPTKNVPLRKPSTAAKDPARRLLANNRWGSPRDPEVVDVCDTRTWSKRDRSSQQLDLARKLPSPGAMSQHSIGQSEKSYGILDYYLDDHVAPAMPKVETSTPRQKSPLIDPAMAKFMFDLTPPKPPASLRPHPLTTCRDNRSQDTKAGAEELRNDLLNSSPAAESRCDNPKDTYSLFPTVRVVTPPRKTSVEQISEPPSTKQHLTNAAHDFAHQEPDAAYRPRRVNLSSSVRSRKDSCSSFSGTRRIPMRVLAPISTPTHPSKITRSHTDSIPSSSPPSQSRWSDGTITSPGVLTTPGIRTSFGSLLGRDSTQYPACFFEDDDDDDETVPFRRKFRWHRPRSSRLEVKEMKGGRFEPREGLGLRLVKGLFGSCCRSR